MSDTYVGEIRLFPIGFAPIGWAYCQGQIMSINQNQMLYALLGTTYGGNGVTTFALPDLRGRVPIHFTPTVPVGAQGGQESHTLTLNEMPKHTHSVTASSSSPSEISPAGNVWANYSVPSYAQSGAKVLMNEQTVSSAGGSMAHSNMQPYIGLHYCIAIQGIYPSPN